MIRYRTHITSGSLDDLTESGTWFVAFGPNVTGGPEGISSGQAILEIVRLGTSAPHLFQRLTIETNGRIYTRCKKPKEEGFYPWSE